METLQLVLLIFAYSVGIVTIFVQLICYNRKIEFKETIFLSSSFLLLIVAITSIYFREVSEDLQTANIFVLLAMTLLGLATPLNVFKEREIVVHPFLKKLLIAIAALIFLLTIIGYFLDFQGLMQYIATAFLASAVIYAMLIVRTTAPSARIKHRERSERITALICLCVLPFTVIIDYFPSQLSFLGLSESNPIKLTLPLLFIFIATGKLVDDIKRLSLFKPEIKSSLQNMKNYNFTKREMEIVELIIKGSTYNQISEELFISLPTVKTHISNIYRKAEVNNKISLINLVKN